VGASGHRIERVLGEVATTTTTIMQTYRIYFLDADDHIKAVEVIDCADDAAAAAIAGALLDERKSYAAIEVWRGKDRVHQARRA
jgi:hypothetical protein